MPIALERKHRVDDVLEDARPGERPSFVTWPTSTMATLRRLASLTRCCAQPRTCVTDPAAEGSDGSAMV